MVQSVRSPRILVLSPAGAHRIHLACLSLVTICIMFLTGCGAINSLVSPAKTLTAIAVSPSSPSIAIGSTQQMTARASYSDGSTSDVSAQATWTSSSPALASVSSTGLVTGIGAGSATVTAAVTGIAGSTQVTVPAAVKTITALNVSPATVTVAVGSTQQLTATATYSDGSTAQVSSAATWTSSSVALATVSKSGLVTATGPGSVTITASMSGLSSVAQVSVPTPAKTLTSIAITPTVATVAIGATQQLSATATYSDSSTANVTSTVAWTSSNPALATVNSSGVVSGVAAGNASISAALSGVSATAQINVPAPVKTLTALGVSPVSASIAVGATQQFTATASYSDGSTANVSAQATWSSSNSAFVSVNASGLVTGIAAGSATLNATFNGFNGSSQVTVPQPPKTVSSIVVTPANPTIMTGATEQFVATATYSDNSTAVVSSTATWSSSNQTAAAITATGLANGLSAGSSSITATLSGVSGLTTLTVVPKTITSIAITPNPGAVAIGATQQLTATATYQDGSTGSVTSSVDWKAANLAVLTVSSSGLVTPVAAGSTTITATLNSVTATDTFTVTIAPGTGVNVSTWQMDVSRSGLNAGETSLSPANVSATNFGKLFTYALDGYSYAEPLLMSNVTINNKVHNVLYAATERDTVYAFDADNHGTGAPLWQTSLLQANETPMTTGPIKPYQGVTSTPVIDPTTNTIYVVSSQVGSGGNATFHLNALDITTGAHKFGSPVTITASVPGTNSDSVGGVVSLTTACVQRSALLLENGAVYIGFGGCHSGWLLSYSASNLAQLAVFNASPNQNGEGMYASAGGIWMGGGGPVADSAGNIYIVTGNGPFDGITSWGDSVLKFNPQLHVTDYFTPYDYGYMNCEDADMAAGGLLLIPGTNQVLAGGKTGKMYSVNTTNMGQEKSSDAGATQSLFFESDKVGPYSYSCSDASGTHFSMINSYEIFGTAAYYNQSVYLGITPTATNVPSGVRQFTYSGGVLTPALQAADGIPEGSYGTTPFISASSASSNGVLWMIDHGLPLQGSGSPTGAILRAYDASNLNTELYNSNMNMGDAPGYGIKFTSPIVANGKVYVSSGHDLVNAQSPEGQIDVYGLK